MTTRFNAGLYKQDHLRMPSCRWVSNPSPIIPFRRCPVKSSSRCEKRLPAIRLHATACSYIDQRSKSDEMRNAMMNRVHFVALEHRQMQSTCTQSCVLPGLFALTGRLKRPAAKSLLRSSNECATLACDAAAPMPPTQTARVCILAHQKPFLPSLARFEMVSHTLKLESSFKP